MTRPIYLDNAATTPVDPRVVTAMAASWTEVFGNPSSDHVHGHEAARAVESARAEIARLVGASSGDVLFTSGATEANHLAIEGVAGSKLASGRRHLIVSAIEHPSVLEPALRLRESGFEISIAPVNSDGRVCVDRLVRLLRDDTLLVSVMFANNEIGTLQPILDITKASHERGALVHCDAVQAMATEKLGPTTADLVTVSAHKMYGPKGIGALIARGPIQRNLRPILVGGGQEKRKRSGTLPVPLIVGFGEAARLTREEGAKDGARLRRLRDELLNALRSLDVHLTGAAAERLPGNAHVRFPGCNGAALLLALRSELSAARGSACSTHENKTSHVLEAVGLSEADANTSLRLTLGRFTTDVDVARGATAIEREVLRLRRLSGSAPAAKSNATASIATG